MNSFFLLPSSSLPSFSVSFSLPYYFSSLHLLYLLFPFVSFYFSPPRCFSPSAPPSCVSFLSCSSLSFLLSCQRSLPSPRTGPGVPGGGGCPALGDHAHVQGTLGALVPSAALRSSHLPAAWSVAEQWAHCPAPPSPPNAPPALLWRVGKGWTPLLASLKESQQARPEAAMPPPLLPGRDPRSMYPVSPRACTHLGEAPFPKGAPTPVDCRTPVPFQLPFPFLHARSPSTPEQGFPSLAQSLQSELRAFHRSQEIGGHVTQRQKLPVRDHRWTSQASFCLVYTQRQRRNGGFSK